MAVIIDELLQIFIIESKIIRRNAEFIMQGEDEEKIKAMEECLWTYSPKGNSKNCIQKNIKNKSR